MTRHLSPQAKVQGNLLSGLRCGGPWVPRICGGGAGRPRDAWGWGDRSPQIPRSEILQIRGVLGHHERSFADPSRYFSHLDQQLGVAVVTTASGPNRTSTKPSLEGVHAPVGAGRLGLPRGWRNRRSRGGHRLPLRTSDRARCDACPWAGCHGHFIATGNQSQGRGPTLQVS